MNSVFKLGMLIALSVSAGATSVSALYYYRPGMLPGQPEVMVPAVIRDVPWFKRHPVELSVKFQACMDNPGMGEHDPECPNAFAAKQTLDIDQLLASMGNRGK